MTDIIDMANDLADQLTSAYVAHERKQNPRLPFIGQCYNCDAPTPHGHNFCDADCRDDWQKRQTAQKRSGSTGNS